MKNQLKMNKNYKEGAGQKLYLKAKKIIPGGTMLLSKRPEMFAPDVWPSYFKKAKGYKIWDLDDREFNDMSIMSVGACIIGYQDDEIDDMDETSDNKKLEEVDEEELDLIINFFFLCVVGIIILFYILKFKKN